MSRRIFRGVLLCSGEQQCLILRRMRYRVSVSLKLPLLFEEDSAEHGFSILCKRRSQGNIRLFRSPGCRYTFALTQDLLQECR
jgi:hypothetical protein